MKLTSTIAAIFTVENREFTLDWSQTTRGSKYDTQIVRGEFKENVKIVALDTPKKSKAAKPTLILDITINDPDTVLGWRVIKLQGKEAEKLLEQAINEGLI